MAATLGLSTYRWNNNIKSVLLLAAFPFLLLLLLSVLFLVASEYFYTDRAGTISRAIFQSYGVDSVTGSHGALDLTCAVALAYWPFIVGAGLLWLVIGYLMNDAMIHRATGAKPVTHAEAPRLYGILETLCISRGLTMPKLYVIETDTMNAYASGVDRRSYAVTVTTGLLGRLDDAELEAVLGHELTHIINRDCRLMIVTILFVGVISFVAQIWWRNLSIMSFRSDRRGSNNMVFMLIAAVIAGIAYFLALALRFAISRRREYLADAGSVELTKRPEALISALRKISVNPDVPHVPSEVRQMFIENPMTGSSFLNLFATHPPLADRIHVLEQLEGGTSLPHDSGSVPEAGGTAHGHQGGGSVPDAGKSA